MRLPILRLLGVILSLGLVPSANAQAPVGSIQGVVRSQNGEPLQAASVLIVGPRLGAQARADGCYTFAGVAAGTCVVRANRIGFGGREKRVVVRGGAAAVAGLSFKCHAR